MFNRSYIKEHKGHPHYITDNKAIALSERLNHSAVEEETLIIIKTLSDPTKLKIYDLLQRVEELPVSDISQILGISQSTASHALSDLKKVGLVKTRRCGHLICYSLIRDRKKDKFIIFLKSL